MSKTKQGLLAAAAALARDLKASFTTLMTYTYNSSSMLQPCSYVTH